MAPLRLHYLILFVRAQVEEICDVLELMLNCPTGDRELIEDLWTHLTSRYQDVTESNITRVYLLLNYTDPRRR